MSYPREHAAATETGGRPGEPCARHTEVDPFAYDGCAPFTPRHPPLRAPPGVASQDGPDHAQPVVRRQCGTGGAVLCRDLPGLAHHEYCPLHRGRPRARRPSGDGRFRTRRPALHRHQRRADVHLQRGRLLRPTVRRPGRVRPLLGGAAGRWWTAVPVRLAQGQVRALLAGLPARRRTASSPIPRAQLRR